MVKASASALSALGLLVIGLAMLSQYAGASGLGWILNGNVVNSQTCIPVVGAIVGSAWNSNYYNVTNKVGNYTLPLGTGNWTVTVSAAGYLNKTYQTQYVTNGAFWHSFALVPVGAGIGNCLNNTKNTTVINVTKTTITPGVNPAQISSTTTIVQQAQQNSVQNTGLYFGMIVVIAILIVAVVYFATRIMHLKKGKGEETKDKKEQK
jgi:hypothetical protein